MWEMYVENYSRKVFIFLPPAKRSEERIFENFRKFSRRRYIWDNFNKVMKKFVFYFDKKQQQHHHCLRLRLNVNIIPRIKGWMKFKIWIFFLVFYHFFILLLGCMLLVIYYYYSQREEFCEIRSVYIGVWFVEFYHHHHHHVDVV